MTDYVFPPPTQPSVPIAGSARRYAVARIFCVGRNYAAHAREMGADPTREPPFYFTKPASALVDSGGFLAYPPATQNLHHEMELVIALGAPVFEADEAAAAAAIWGCAGGLDMTRRDLQNAAKASGKPWDTGKAFEQSAVITPLVPGVPAPDAQIRLHVNGALRQSARLAEMIWSLPEIVANLSHLYHLGPGDLIYTGTPEGVGPVQRGDVLHGHIDGLPPLHVTLA